jgi:CRP-like cAMP-binding protein
MPVERKQLGSDGPERLAAIGVLGDLSTGRRRELARLADELTAAPGEILMHEGEPGYEFMMLEQGSASVLQGERQINSMGPGDCFGELAVLADGVPRSASVIASTDVRAIVLTARFMRQFHDLVPAVGERIDEVADERRERDARRQAGLENDLGDPPAS